MRFIQLKTAKTGNPVAVNIELIGYVHEFVVDGTTYGEVYMQGQTAALKVQEDMKTILNLIAFVSGDFEIKP